MNDNLAVALVALGIMILGSSAMLACVVFRLGNVIDQWYQGWSRLTQPQKESWEE